MLTENPVKMFGLNASVLEKGKNADVLIFDDDINVSYVFVGGKQTV